MKHKLSLITLAAMITVAATFSLALMYNMVSVSRSHIKNTERELRVLFIKRQKEAIRQEINRLINRIAIERAEVFDNAQKSLRHRVNAAFDLINSQAAGNLTANSISSKLINLNNSGRNEYATSNYFAMGANGNIIYDGGANTALKDVDFKNFIQRVYKLHEAYGSFVTKHNGISAKQLVFARYDTKSGILIGSSIAQEEIDNSAKSIVLSEIKKDTYGYEDSGYFLVFTPQYKTIYHPSKEFSGANIQDLRDLDGKYFVREAVKLATHNNGAFITYQWRDPVSGKVAEKVSYIKYIKDWNWIIGTGFYFTSFNELAVSEQNVIKDSTRKDLYSNLALITVLFGLTLVIALYISRRLNLVEQKEAKFVNELEQYKYVLDETSIVSMTDPAGHMIYVNDKFCQISGYSREFLLGKKHNVMRHPDTPNELFKDLWNTISNGDIWRGIIKNLRNDGTHFYHNVTIIPYRDETGHISHYTSCSQNITELIENREKLQNVFTTDRLTGLGNRYKLLNDLSTAKMPAIALIDIDRFHEINEIYGMEQGDKLLTLVADKMISIKDLNVFNIYRLHSDVFAVMAPYIDLKVFTDKVISSVDLLTRDVHVLDGKEIYLTFRIGFADDNTDTASKADIALQMAKSQNTNHVVYDISNINNAESYEQNFRISKLINSAIENDRIMPFYQPILNFSTGEIDKYECLIRMIDDNGDVVPPSQFLQVSKQTRLYPKLTCIVAQKAIDTFKNMDKEFSINLSEEDLLNTATMEYIYSYAKQAGVLSRMCVEILETEQLHCNNGVAELISRFKKEGAKIAIDDFGTGYSNFDYLLKIQADYIKIDGSIIKLISKDSRAVDIVNSIVRYAKKMGLKTIGEYISDRDIAIKAKSLKVDYAQGYYFGKAEIEPAEKPDNQL